MKIKSKKISTKGLPPVGVDPTAIYAKPYDLLMYEVTSESWAIYWNHLKSDHWDPFWYIYPYTISNVHILLLKHIDGNNQSNKYNEWVEKSKIVKNVQDSNQARVM